MDNSYYLVRKLPLMKAFDQAIGNVKKVFISSYGESTAESIVAQARQEFEFLLSRLPYIGGDQNPLTRNLIESAWFLALYRVLKSYGKPDEEAATVSYRASEAALGSYYARFTRFIYWLKFSRFAIARLKRRAAVSQQRAYPGDWVFDVVEGDGKTFDYGVTYTECGLCKFYRSQGAEALLPYLCQLDLAVSRVQGIGAARTGTLAEGHACDFRFKRVRSVRSGLPTPSVNS